MTPPPRAGYMEMSKEFRQDLGQAEVAHSCQSNSLKVIEGNFSQRFESSLDWPVFVKLLE